MTRSFWESVAFGPGCWEWQGYHHRLGYGFYKTGGKRYLAHRYAYELLVGRIPPDLDLCHVCDNPPCVRPTHMFVGTAQDNILDAVAKGRWPQGETHPKARLTEPLVREIRALAAEGAGMRWLGRKFGVSSPTICQVVKRRSWKHVS